MPTSSWPRGNWTWTPARPNWKPSSKRAGPRSPPIPRRCARGRWLPSNARWAVIASAFEKRINSVGSLTSHTIGTAFLANVFGSAMYVSLILTPKIMAKNYDRLGLARKNLSRNAEFGGTLTCGMVPWSDNGIFMAGVLGVATLDYLPYMWLSFTCIIVTITLAYLGKAVNRVPVIEAASSR